MLGQTPNPAGSAPSVLVVLLNWNSFEETVAAVQAVLATDYPNFSIVVIDNASTERPAEDLGQLASERVRVLFNQENLGYTGGCNQGIALALERGDDFVWLLNNDALVSPGTLRSLVDLAETDPKLALVSPQIGSLQEPDRFLNVGGVFRPEIPLFEGTNTAERGREQARTQPAEVIVMGTAMLARSSALREVGGLDHRFFAYWEDSDLAARCIRAGYRNAVDFGSTVWHSNKNYLPDPNALRAHYWYYMSRNETLFWRKHLPWGPRLLKALLWAFKHDRLRMAALSRNADNRQALASGVWDGWLGRTGPWVPGRRAPAFVQRLLRPRPSPAGRSTTNAAPEV